MKIERIDNLSPYFEDVKDLGRVNSPTLGFFPVGAFQDYAKRKQILVAINDNGEFMGYLLYRVSRMRVTIVHLCIKQCFRGQKVAKNLVNSLYKESQDFLGIGLLCRRDYPANEIWPSLGFVAKSEKVGRSKSGELLTFWWHDHGHPSLFSYANRNICEEMTKVVLDANVVIDLYNNNGLSESEESSYLLADWLEEFVALCITDELYNEINRNESPSERKEFRNFVENKFVILPSDNLRFMQISNDLKKYFPTSMRSSTQSDLRQLARTISGEAQFFITRDELLLQKSDMIQSEFGITILRPCDLIIRLDELLNENKYQPVALAGSNYQILTVKSGQESKLAERFLCTFQSESKNDFKNLVRKILADPNSYQANIILNANNELIAFFVYDIRQESLLDIPLFRVYQNKLSETLTRHLILRTVLKSCHENRLITKFSDPYLSENSKIALAENYFVNNSDGWVKVNINGIRSIQDIKEELLSLNESLLKDKIFIQDLSQTMKFIMESGNSNFLSKIEKIFWPCKIPELEVPTYIIPIKPQWARHLFDEKLASNTLFGADATLMLNRENIYYRSKKPNILSYPARILWYVSYNKDCFGSKALRACSSLDEILIGKPKELYSQFKRLGVYEWRDVYKTAKNCTEEDIMAIRFSNTEIFDNPIEWEQLSDLLNKKSPIQAPLKIPTQVFLELYQFGFKKL